MKTIFSRSASVIALSLAMGLTACEKQLDLNPAQSVDAATALDTEEKVGSGVVGMYALLDDPNLYGTNLILVPELLAADSTYINWQGTFTNFSDIANRTTNARNSTAEGIWRVAYQTINQSNLILDALPVVTTPELKKQYEGEARFVRADLYFELVRLYAKQYEAGGTNTQLGVPINLVPVKNVEQAGVQVPRSTVAEVYNQVITDLVQADKLLPKSNGTRASRYTAKALLARVYLQQGNFQKAGEMADSVITYSAKSLSPTLQAVFTNRNSSETLLEIQQNDQNNAGTANSGLATHFASIGQLGRADVAVEGYFAEMYELQDARGTDSLPPNRTRKLIYVGNGARAGALRSGKYTAYGQNIPVIRLAEMYLIRSEAAFRAGNKDAALLDVNRVRERSGATPIKAEDLTLDAILLERQLELAFEGFRIHDLKRTGKRVTSSEPITEDILVLPIPQREINVNPLLQQNPGY
ncbi:RagB/SusD family nutrient uptake outer membrane protein [Hymenobacter sediminis]|uniref:RagB/SusD family nutrient uptake outer membrane protein n=1 Tax=Hymenobacter sediminis TaxID=2218621 RepID=UPI000DA69B2F|nr:RagB/SusD family nutrient uptake outer membrane protein [Hymenobacter sediminis]RPD50306.1 RagB/SusD family nutrient uptake outer membrane protein [Hymenobacter sediminis]